MLSRLFEYLLVTVVITRQRSLTLGLGALPVGFGYSSFSCSGLWFWAAEHRLSRLCGAGAEFAQAPSTHSLSLTWYGVAHTMSRRHDRPNLLALSHHRKTWRRWDGRGLQGRRHAPAPFRGAQVPA